MPASLPGAELPLVPHAASARPGVMANKVPAITAVFWIIKVLSTTVGETGADYQATFGTGPWASRKTGPLSMSDCW